MTSRVEWCRSFKTRVYINGSSTTRMFTDSAKPAGDTDRPDIPYLVANKPNNKARVLCTGETMKLVFHINELQFNGNFH